MLATLGGHTTSWVSTPKAMNESLERLVFSWALMLSNSGCLRFFWGLLLLPSRDSRIILPTKKKEALYYSVILGKSFINHKIHKIHKDHVIKQPRWLNGKCLAGSAANSRDKGAVRAQHTLLFAAGDVEGMESYPVKLCIYIHHIVWCDMIWYDLIWYDMIWYDIIYIYTQYIFMYLEPQWLLFSKVNPPNKVFSNQNKGHLGSRYIYRARKLNQSLFRAFDSPLRKKDTLSTRWAHKIVIHEVITILFHPEIRFGHVGIVIFDWRPY